MQDFLPGDSLTMNFPDIYSTPKCVLEFMLDHAQLE